MPLRVWVLWQPVDRWTLLSMFQGNSKVFHITLNILVLLVPFSLSDRLYTIDD